MENRRMFTAWAVALWAIALLSFGPADAQLLAGDCVSNGDGRVGFADFLHFAKAYGSERLDYDFSCNATVDFAGYVIFAQFYGQRASHDAGSK